jgi:cytochrome P450
MMELLYNPLDPAFRKDPYPFLHRLRSEDPVHWSPVGFCWVLTRYEDVRTVLGDRNAGIGLDRLAKIPALQPVFAEPYNQIIKTQILAADPPSHTRIRGLLAPVFTTARSDGLRAHTQRAVDRLIEARAHERRMDFITDFAYPLPFTVICDLLDVPLSERAPLEDYTHKLMRTTDPTPMTPREVNGANEAATGFRDYFMALAHSRRGNPGDDLFTLLVRARDEGQVDDEEMIANTILIFCAGHDTVVNLFGNGLLALHRHPDQLELLRRDPSLVKNAVEELLRYDTSVQIARRVAFQDFWLGGKLIRENDYVLCSVGAANRDPAIYPDPDRLDVTRKNIRPLSFGGGIHYCLGAPLARVEGDVVFRTLVERLPSLRLETLDPPWHQNTFVRGLSSLPVSW